MGTIYYIFDDNGKIFSEDKTRRFTALEGMRLHDYMKTEASRKAYFLKTENEKGDVIAVQMPEEMAKEYEEERKHSSYLRSFEDAFQFISLDMSTGEDEVDTLESFISDEEDEDVFVSVCKQLERENLRKALGSLNAKELLVITTMFLGKRELSEREVSAITGLPQKTVNNRKKVAFKKISTFLKK